MGADGSGVLTGTVAAGAGACYDGGEDGGLAGGTSGGKYGDVAARVGDVLGWPCVSLLLVSDRFGSSGTSP